MLMIYYPCKDGEESPMLESYETQVILFWQELFLEAEGDGLIEKFGVLKNASEKFQAKNRRIFDRARFVLFCPYTLAPDEHKRHLATGHKTVCEFFSPTTLKGKSAYKNISREVQETLLKLSSKYDKTVCNR